MVNETNAEDEIINIYNDYMQLLDDSQAGILVNYVIFRIEDAMFKYITGNSNLHISWDDFIVKIRDSFELTSLIENIVVESLNNVHEEQYDFSRSEQRIEWFDKTSQNFEPFIALPPYKKGIGYLYIIMYWAERLYYKESGGIDDKKMWLEFCNKIKSNETLYYKIHRGFLHVVVGIDFDKYIPDIDTLLDLFG